MTTLRDRATRSPVFALSRNRQCLVHAQLIGHSDPANVFLKTETRHETTKVDLSSTGTVSSALRWYYFSAH